MSFELQDMSKLVSKRKCRIFFCIKKPKCLKVAFQCAVFKVLNHLRVCGLLYHRHFQSWVWYRDLECILVPLLNCCLSRCILKHIFQWLPLWPNLGLISAIRLSFEFDFKNLFLRLIIRLNCFQGFFFFFLRDIQNGLFKWTLSGESGLVTHCFFLCFYFDHKPDKSWYFIIIMSKRLLWSYKDS